MKTTKKLLALACALGALLCGCRPRTTSLDDVLAIQNNLSQYQLYGRQFLLESDRPEARHADIVGEGKFLRELRPVNGEDYTGLVVTASTQSLTVTAADGTAVTYSER